MPEPTPPERGAMDPQRDFDFFFGTWRVRHHRLLDRLKGSRAWEEFETTAETWPLWGGAASVTQLVGETPSGPLNGMAVRLLDPQTRQWRLYWASRVIGLIEDPVIGGFRDGRGEFFSHELWEGRGIFVRAVWSDITPLACRWEQAFSDDGGRTWETNWAMEFIRT